MLSDGFKNELNDLVYDGAAEDVLRALAACCRAESTPRGPDDNDRETAARYKSLADGIDRLLAGLHAGS